jgi:GxxExxY protein
VPIKVEYRDRMVGDYFADLVVEDLVIVEVKAVRALLPKHEAQLLNYLKATDYEVGLLLNFGPSGKVIRKVFDNKSK